MSGIHLAVIAPHPPIIIKAVGGKETEKAAKTRDALKDAARQVAALKPDTVVLISPHGPVFRDAVAVFDGERMRGDLASFNAPEATLEVDVDKNFIAVLQNTFMHAGCTLLRLNQDTSYLYNIERKLDHGALVPMLYLQEAGVTTKYVNITYGLYPYADLYMCGEAIQRAALKSNQKVVVIASGDLSHCLMPGAPAGYREEGLVFDRKVVEGLENGNTEDLLTLDEELVEKAGECGLRSIIMALGSLDGRKFKPEILSYEGPFGVGYLVATLMPTEEKVPLLAAKLKARKKEKMAEIRAEESFPVSLARSTVESYIKEGKRLDPPQDVPSEFKEAAGAFVSLKREGQLRGCIGTTEPATEDIVQEIIQNAISAATRDPRFSAIKKEELAGITYSVDILMPPEPIAGIEDLDPHRYGVLVESRGKRGLLLPDLPGVDSPEEQVRIASEKAGIAEDEEVQLYRFRVKRFT